MFENNKKGKTLIYEFMSLSPETLLARFETSLRGLSEDEAAKRLEVYGYNEPAKKKKRTIVFQLFSKIVNPLVIVLLIIAGFSFFFGEKVSALLVMLMALMSVFLSFFQEHRAGKEAEKLSEMVRATATVYRNGAAKEKKIKELVPGDIVDLFAGDMVPADIRILSCKDLFINQASLTGESFPIEKTFEPVSQGKFGISDIPNIIYMGSSVESGTALGIVVHTGLETQFGELSKRLSAISEHSSFERGVKSFMWLMIRLMIVLVLVIFGINALLKHNMVEAFLFALSVAVGLTPEMLPMLVTLNLSKGAIAMSKKDVIVKRLNAIQNFGAMDVLCTDKTGTLTQDKIVVEKYCDVVRNENEEVLKYAYLNSFYQTGLKNVLDRAVLKYQKFALHQFKKIDEIPFDFSRKMMSVVIGDENKHTIIVKGAPEEVYKRCAKFELEGEILALDDSMLLLTELRSEYDHLSSEGFRVLAVAYKDFDQKKERYTKDDEHDLILKGYIAFLDPPKTTARKTIEVLRGFGIEFKVLTGDNELVTKKICTDVGLDIRGFANGEQVEKANDAQLRELVKTTTVFARLSPLQKERVINALHANKHIVGYLGDGINDAPALKAADVGISVNNAVDIAKESADIILLKKSLAVLEDGVVEGRKTFGNILKYIKMGASSNFGNMISVTVASIFLPFLPMLPIQILLNNFLYDLSQVAIPSDEVDGEYLLKTRPWNVSYIQKFMIFLGPVSSLFDIITFLVLWYVFKASAPFFQTGWFLESLCTQTLVIHIIRTGKIPFIESKPSQFLMFTSIYIVTIGLLLPFLPLGRHFGFVAPPMSYFAALLIIVSSYLLLVQVVKTWFIKKYGYE
jgi:P-type Mg2+ transporter